MNRNEPKVYAVKHKDSDTRAQSRSGGIFTALSDQILEENGIVYGCVLTDDFNAIHFRAENAADRNKMRGSKYIQSNMGDIFKVVLKDLNAGKSVLFSGTSCQIAGLHAFLGKEYRNLFCVDIVCHGVPSPAVWQAYLKWQEEKNNAGIKSVDFRNKTDYGWSSHVESLYLDNGRKVDSRVFTTLFYGHSILRPCCYKCPYKSTVHPGDITIADYWGIDKAAPGFNDNKGVSLVLVNNKTGLDRFEQAKDKIEWKETRIEDSIQRPLVSPCEKPDGREKFWDDFSDKPFDTIARKYGGYGAKNGIRKKLGAVKRKLKETLNKSR